MSVTFSMIDASGRIVGGREPSAEEPCMCAQDAPSWLAGVDGQGLDRPDLAAHAWADCARCQGTGVETVPGMDRLYLNLNNGNARALLALLGWAAAPSQIPLGEIRVGEPTGEFDLMGERALPDARRAVMVARATFDRRAGALVRESETLYGAPRVREDGAVDMRPRVMVGGLDAEGLRDRLESFAALVEEGATLGAVQVTWG